MRLGADCYYLWIYCLTCLFIQADEDRRELLSSFHRNMKTLVIFVILLYGKKSCLRIQAPLTIHVPTHTHAHSFPHGGSHTGLCTFIRKARSYNCQAVLEQLELKVCSRVKHKLYCLQLTVTNKAMDVGGWQTRSSFLIIHYLHRFISVIIPLESYKDLIRYTLSWSWRKLGHPAA